MGMRSASCRRSRAGERMAIEMIHVLMDRPNRVIRWPVESSPIEYVCPYCDQLVCARYAYDRVDGVPIVLPFRTTWIGCSACGKEARSKVRTLDLAPLDVAERADFICRYQSFVARSMVVIAIVTCLVPFLGLIMSVFAFVANFRE